MADARLRDLERQALTDPEARAEWILCQLRRDAFPPYRVELCARLGDDAARAAMNLPGRARLDLQLGRSLAEHGTDLTCRVALAAGAAATRAEGDESALRALNEVLSIAHQLYRERTKRGAKALAVAITTASRLRTRHKGAEAVRTAGHAVCLEPRSNAIWQSWYAGRSLEAAIEAPGLPAIQRTIVDEVVPWVLGLDDPLEIGTAPPSPPVKGPNPVAPSSWWTAIFGK